MEDTDKRGETHMGKSLEETVFAAVGQETRGSSWRQGQTLGWSLSRQQRTVKTAGFGNCERI